MSIDISKHEYKCLLQLLEIAHWVLHSTKHEPDPRTKEYRKLEQKLLACADEFDCGDCVERTQHGLDFSAKYRDSLSAHELIKEFENDTFWDELISRLAIRDMYNDFLEEQLEAMSPEQRLELYFDCSDTYAKEFEVNGLSTLVISAFDSMYPPLTEEELKVLEKEDFDPYAVLSGPDLPEDTADDDDTNGSDAKDAPPSPTLYSP